MIEEIIMVGVVGNFMVQVYDILWCRFHDCGNKNSEEKDKEYKITYPSTLPDTI